MARRTRDGSDIGADQALTLDESLRAHTLVAAQALWMDAEIGSLEPGKLADLAVLDGDLTQTTVDDLPAVPVSMTMLGGEVVYQR